MPEAVDIEIVDAPEGTIRTRIRFSDDRHVGHRAALVIEEYVDVHDSRGINDSRDVHRHEFTIDGEEHVFDTPEHTLEVFTFSGKMVDVKLRAKLTVDDGVLWDTTLEEPIVRRLGRLPKVLDDAKSAVEPRDLFNLVANLRAIPLPNKILAIGLLLVGGIVLAVNTFLGVHDQFVPESSTYFYSHRDSDGDAESPFINSLAMSGAAGAAIWFALRSQLRTYMRFRLLGLPERVDRGTRLRIGEIVTGNSRVDLFNARLRIVACNMEKGQYKRGSGTDERTVSFSEPIRAVVLFDEMIELIRRNTPVESHFDDTISFGTMFDCLYPPMMVSTTHGLAVHWEVQLLQDDLVDQELVGSTEKFVVEEFHFVEAHPVDQT